MPGPEPEVLTTYQEPGTLRRFCWAVRPDNGLFAARTVEP